jgi:hypothetical protein
LTIQVFSIISIAMQRRAFFSFHYVPDNWRASQVRNIGVVEGDAPATDNDWETVTRGGDAAIQKWIDNQMGGRSCLIVLIGSETAGRKWINYEICKAWNDGKGVLGIRIHNLKDRYGKQTRKGENPFDSIKLLNGNLLSSLVISYDPPYEDSAKSYGYIAANLSMWVENSIRVRGL